MIYSTVIDSYIEKLINPIFEFLQKAMKSKQLTVAVVTVRNSTKDWLIIG